MLTFSETLNNYDHSSKLRDTLPVRYRMVSWWLRDELLQYPSAAISKSIQQRAAAMAAAGCDSAIIFGAHFRWDYLPVFDLLHACISEIAAALHANGLKLFDHHSVSLQARKHPELKPVHAATVPRRHVSLEEITRDADNWEYNSSRLTSWYMRNTVSGEPLYYPGYAAYQCCINNPDFRAAYRKYVKKLLQETGIDGLMADDAIFFYRFYACSCKHCRNKFGRELPPASDLEFWGNWKNQDFLDWIHMRHTSVADFNSVIRGALPSGFPLLNCSSGSTSASVNEVCCGVDEFMRASNTVMLEMCGNTPNLDGAWTHKINDQLYHLCIGKKYNVPVIGLGYAFSEKNAEFVWAFNKFLGSGTWISTLKHRLGLPEALWKHEMPDEAELVAKAFLFEKRHTELFNLEPITDTGIFFSRFTRDNYGGYNVDYGLDYAACCRMLFDQGINFAVVSAIPHPASSFKYLVLPSAACLSNQEITELEIFRQGGGKVFVLGPVGVFDEKGRRRTKPWIDIINLPDIKRTPKFPHDTWEKMIPARCLNAPKWYHVAENLEWHPQRLNDGMVTVDINAEPLPQGWRIRRFADPDGRHVIHGLAAELKLQLDDALEAKRTAFLGNNIITDVIPRHAIRKISLRLPKNAAAAELYLPPDRDEPLKLFPKKGRVEFMLPKNCFYFLIATTSNPACAAEKP
jgi:hypothetical protein